MQVIDFHNHPQAKAKWSDMEKFHELRALGLAPEAPHQVEMPSDVDPFDRAFYFVPDKDPA